ncbi:hypothetical protein [Treponema denticola]|uniref:Uncharacterized protein n=1 Tax=Treponema denticola SP33 TaxID=999437 RepID=M2BJ85_TREDN|nr:hypothetical protein [Treponema denticola]EMB22029.1 hypothetical protein HMPREF9733_02366 [Treponema denticola SP33]EPF35850.1 hypothetical protein HMPREF9732_02080 [Treponema denticola SP32]
MKRILFPILFFVLIFTSCSLFFQEEYGTITIDLEGGRARSINSSTGLPNLADSELEIDILTDGNSSIYKKILASEPKFFQADFPVGSRLEITVKLNGPSSSWSAYNNHTVKEGNNDIQLLLNKNASSLANVGFSTTAANTYEFNIAGKKINISSNEQPVFTRDSRGRLYIAYKQSDWALNRYESDGTPNNFAGSLPPTITGASSVNLASDPVTGKVYAAANSHLYLIKDDGSVIAGSPTIPAGPIAVYNNNLFALGVSAVSGNNPLKMFTITEEGSVLTLNQAGSTVSVSTGQIIISGTPINVDFKDILVKNDKIYILFAKNSLPSGTPPAHYYSLGGMLEYTYNSSGISGLQKYGFNDTVTAKDGIVTAGEANFYGPACFIGYDEQSISIADDGCTFKKVGGSVRIYKNVNRVFSFNTSTKSLYSYATENKWFKEYEVTGGSTPSPGTGKVLLWQKNTNPNLGMEYYQVDEGGYTGLPTAFIAGSNTGGYPHYPTDVFCHDEKGNLYILWVNKAGGTPVKYQYKVRKYALLSSGVYDSTYEAIIGLEDFFNQNTPITEISVHVSESNSYLYYTYKNTFTYIKRLKWTGDNFSAALKDNSFEQKIKGAGGSKSFCTALAVNENGIFAAVKNIDGSDIENPDTYGSNIKKYKHQKNAGDSDYSDGEVSIIPSTSVNTLPENNYTLEDICDLQIKGGVLYGIRTKKTGKLKNGTTSKVSTSGELFKIEALDSSFLSSTVVTSLWSSLSPTDGYAPYRFIGTVPNKLIIASDGYYGDKNSAGNKAQNKNKVLTFDINTTSTIWTVTHKDTDATFSRELTHDTTNGFKWE